MLICVAIYRKGLNDHFKVSVNFEGWESWKTPLNLTMLDLDLITKIVQNVNLEVLR